jgi:hypothetical protein
MLKVLIKEWLLADTSFFGFERFKFFLNLLLCFIQTVITGRRFFSIFLFHLNPFEICVFIETEIKLVKLAPLLIVFLVKGVLQVVMGWRRQGRHDFNMVVHIKPFSGFVPSVGFALFLFLVLALSHLHDWVNILANGLILDNVPWDIAMSLVVVDDGGAQVAS